MYDLAQMEEFRRLFAQVVKQVLAAAQELHALERPDARAAVHELRVGFGAIPFAGAVDPVEIRPLDHFPRWSEGRQRRPVSQDGFLDLADNAVFPDVPDAAPVVGVDAHAAGLALGAIAPAQDPAAAEVHREPPV